MPLPKLAAHVDDERGQPVGALRRLVARRGARQQQHQVGVLGAAGPDLLAVDDVVVALALGEGAQRGGVGAAGRLGDAERLQAQFAGGDLRQVLLLLPVGAVPQDGAHDVHLRVARGAVAALGLHGLQDRRGGGQRQAGAAIFLGDQRGEVAGLGQRADELGGIAALAGPACASIRRGSGRRAWRPRRGFRRAGQRNRALADPSRSPLGGRPRLGCGVRRCNGTRVRRQGNRVKASKVRGFTPGTPPGGAASWTSAKGIALGTLYFVGRTGGGISAVIASTPGRGNPRRYAPSCSSNETDGLQRLRLCRGVQGLGPRRADQALPWWVSGRSPDLACLTRLPRVRRISRLRRGAWPARFAAQARKGRGSLHVSTHYETALPWPPTCRTTPSATCSASPPGAKATARRSAAWSTAARRASPLSEADIQPWLDRRRPGPVALHHPAPGARRRSASCPACSTGVTTGTPIALLIDNVDQRSRDYSAIAAQFRPGHADLTYELKYGIRDYRGGGRSSARETAMRVAAGGVARQVLGDARAHPRRAGADRPAQDRPRALGLGCGGREPVLLPRPGHGRAVGRATCWQSARPAPPPAR